MAWPWDATVALANVAAEVSSLKIAFIPHVTAGCYGSDVIHRGTAEIGPGQESINSQSTDPAAPLVSIEQFELVDMWLYSAGCHAMEVEYARSLPFNLIRLSVCAPATFAVPQPQAPRFLRKSRIPCRNGAFGSKNWDC